MAIDLTQYGDDLQAAKPRAANRVQGALTNPDFADKNRVMFQNSPNTVQNPVTGANPNSSMYNYAGAFDANDPQSMMFTAPNLRNVNKKTDTVQGQLRGILKSDSPLMQLSARTGREEAAKRGLLNSSLAGEAAQTAMIREARPIAEQDAAAYMKQGLTNQDYENQALSTLRDVGAKDYLSNQDSDRASDRMRAEYNQKNIFANKEVMRERGTMQKEYGLKDWLAGNEDGRKSKLLAEEYGFKMEETAGKQNAALWAQFIQGAAEINKSDMTIAEKNGQIAAMKNATLTGMATNSMQFNDPTMYKFITNQTTAIATAAEKATEALKKETEALAAAETAVAAPRSTGNSFYDKYYGEING